jgi:hypothetical protein
MFVKGPSCIFVELGCWDNHTIDYKSHSAWFKYTYRATASAPPARLRGPERNEIAQVGAGRRAERNHHHYPHRRTPGRGMRA